MHTKLTYFLNEEVNQYDYRFKTEKEFIDEYNRLYSNSPREYSTDFGKEYIRLG